MCRRWPFNGQRKNYRPSDCIVPITIDIPRERMVDHYGGGVWAKYSRAVDRSKIGHRGILIRTRSIYLEAVCMLSDDWRPTDRPTIADNDGLAISFIRPSAVRGGPVMVINDTAASVVVVSWFSYNFKCG